MFKSIVATATAVALAFSSPASAKLEALGKVGPWTVAADAEDGKCGMGMQRDNKVFVISFNARSMTTTLLFANKEYADLTGRTIDIVLTVDGKSYNWQAEGGPGMISVVSTDPIVPVELHKAERFALSVNGVGLVGIVSDAEFDSALETVVKCSFKLNETTSAPSGTAI